MIKLGQNEDPTIQSLQRCTQYLHVVYARSELYVAHTARNVIQKRTHPEQKYTCFLFLSFAWQHGGMEGGEEKKEQTQFFCGERIRASLRPAWCKEPLSTLHPLRLMVLYRKTTTITEAWSVSQALRLRRSAVTIWANPIEAVFLCGAPRFSVLEKATGQVGGN